MISAVVRINSQGKKVLAAQERKERRVLFRIGGAVKNTIRRLLRKGEGKSPPGKPPHSHTFLLRDGVLFNVDIPASTVTVGVAPLPSKTGVAKTVYLLEHGGLAPNGDVYFRRPFVKPGYQKSVPSINKIWREER